MQWEQIVEIIREIIVDIRRECIIQNAAIRDDIFGILEKVYSNLLSFAE